MIRTYIDSGVLFWAHRGQPALAAKAMGILGDTNREFVSSVFLRLETLPKAVYFKNRDEVSFYEAFFDEVKEWASPLDIIMQEAHQEACRSGLGAIDALHVVAAVSMHADELITTERPTSPLHRVTSIKIITLYPVI